MSNGQMTAPEIPGQTATDTNDFADLGPDLSQDGVVTPSNPPGPGAEQIVTADEDIDLGAMDFETLLAGSQPVAAPQTPAPTTPVQPALTTPAQPTQVAAPQVPAAQGAQPVPGAVAPQAAQPQPAVVPGQPVAPVQTPQQQTQPVDQTQVFDQLRAGVQQNRQVLVDQVASHYAATITDADVDELNTDPRKALAGMAARVHVDGLQNILAVISQNLPSMVSAVVEAQRTHIDAANEFYSQYQGFDRAKHSTVINQVAQTVRQMNPQMDAQTFKALVASIAAQTLGLQIQQTAPQQTQPAAQPQMRTPRGFAPAGAVQMQQPAPQANGQANPWQSMVEQMQTD